jgi:hypothetical protein
MSIMRRIDNLKDQDDQRVKTLRLCLQPARDLADAELQKTEG